MTNLTKLNQQLEQSLHHLSSNQSITFWNKENSNSLLNMTVQEEIELEKEKLPLKIFNRMIEWILEALQLLPDKYDELKEAVIVEADSLKQIIIN